MVINLLKRIWPVAISDLIRSYKILPMWLHIGTQTVKLRYRRSILGPIWLVLTTIIKVLGLGLVYSALFKVQISEYLPYVAVGLIVWGHINTYITQGCNVFIKHRRLITNTNMPLTGYIFNDIVEESFSFLHQLSIMVGIYLIWPFYLNANILWAVPAILLIQLNAIWVGIIMGMICARYRDVPNIVTSIMQILFLITPVFWMPKLLSERAIFVDINPFYHFLHIVRSGLLGEAPDLNSWLVAIAITLIGWLLAINILNQYRYRVVYAV